MNDTHGETGKGWYGFDLDGTLAKYDKWFGPEKEPARVRLENAHKAINDLLNDWPEGVR